MRINMTIDLEIDEGLYIKIDAKGKVSIKSEEPGEEAKYAPPKPPSTWAEAKQEILAERNTGGLKPSDTHHAMRELILSHKEPFTIPDFIPLHGGTQSAARQFIRLIVQNLISEGKVRQLAPHRKLGQQRGSTPALYEVVP